MHQLEGLEELQQHFADFISLLALSSQGIAASHSMGKSLQQLVPDSTITLLLHSAATLVPIEAILAVRQLAVSFQLASTRTRNTNGT